MLTEIDSFLHLAAGHAPCSSKFLKKVDPAHPPKMVVEKYEDPIRTEAIPIDWETHWTGAACFPISP